MKPIFQFATIFLLAIFFSPSCKKEFSCETCRDSNQPPVANAGPDQTLVLATDSTTLDGSASTDPDGTISDFRWTKISGPASFTMTNTGLPRVTVANLSAGTYVFELKVTDDSGLSATDTVQVLVNASAPVDHPPVANAGPDQTVTLPASSFVMDGMASSDPDNNITHYHWSKITGPASFNITGADQVQSTVTGFVQGTYQFELMVTDAGGLFSKDSITIIVKNPDGPLPIADAGPDIVITLPLDSVYLDGYVSAGIHYFKWICVAGPQGSSITFPNSLFQDLALVKGLTPGLYYFELTGFGTTRTSTDTMTVLVVNDPSDPNTITFKNRKWYLADQYGTGIVDLNIDTPSQPNLFLDWDKLRPIEIFLQTDPAPSAWISLSSVQSGIFYAPDAARPVIWIARIPPDPTWVGKESSIKIKLL